MRMPAVFTDKRARELQARLRAHLKAKYGPAKTAAYHLKCSQDLIYRVLQGRAFPPDSMLEDAGIKARVVQTIVWSEKRK